MAKRVQSLCAVIERDYGGDGSRVWTEAADAADLKARLAALPGIGDMKVRSLFATIVKRLGYRPDGWEDALPEAPHARRRRLAPRRWRPTRPEKRAAQGRQARAQIVIIERSMNPEWLSNSYLVGDESGGTGVIIDCRRAGRAADRRGRRRAT